MRNPFQKYKIPPYLRWDRNKAMEPVVETVRVVYLEDNVAIGVAFAPFRRCWRLRVGPHDLYLTYNAATVVMIQKRFQQVQTAKCVDSDC